MNYKTITLESVYHVGTMDERRKGNNSYEGSGLSVSVHPDEWTYIARLSGGLFELKKQTGTFLDFHELTSEQLAEIVEWGITYGYIVPSKVYFYSWIDGETEEEVRFESYSIEEIQEEIDASGEEESVQVKDGFKATTLIEKETLREKISPGEVKDLLVTTYAEKCLELDGVWWNDFLNKYHFSAPRGVIFRSKLAEWKIDKVDVTTIQ